MHDSLDLDVLVSQLSHKLHTLYCDREFVGTVKEDLEVLLNNEEDVCMLFPNLKPIFLKVLWNEAVIFGLRVFNIGQGRNTAVVVYKKSSIVRRKTNAYCRPKATQIYEAIEIMEEEETLSCDSEKRSNRSSKPRPTQRFYVPPAKRTVNKRSSMSSKIFESDTLMTATDGENTLGLTRTSSCKIKKDVLMQIGTKHTIDTSHEDNLSGAEGVDIRQCESHLLTEPENNSEASTFVTQPNRPEIVKSQRPSDVSAESEDDSGELSIDTTVLKQLKNLFIERPDYDATIAKQSFDDEDNTLLKSDQNLYISKLNNSTNISHAPKDDGDSENNKIQRTIENINRRSKPLIKHIRTDDTLRITTNNKTTSYRGSDSDNAEEANLSNWDDMFDEQGDLQKGYRGQITKHIGCDVQILKTTNDYSSYQNIMLQDLDHVIELYDFPSSFKTQDIMQLYAGAYQDTMYVKWCDETHALLVLSTPAQAQRALQIEHDLIKSRPLIEASKIALAAAISTNLKPAMKRPQTNMQTARRLINTHLGTKIKLSKEVLEQERKVLISAKEQKRLKRQNEKDAWEGNLRGMK